MEIGSNPELVITDMVAVCLAVSVVARLLHGTESEDTILQADQETVDAFVEEIAMASDRMVALWAYR